MGSAVEVGCSLLLLLGLSQRLVIQLFAYPNAWPEHLTWGSILLFLLSRGGGTVSLDHLVWGRPTP